MKISEYRLPKAAWYVLGAMLLIVTHAWLIQPVLQNGDAAVYNEQIECHVIDVRTTHVGYMLLGIVANHVLPFDVERNLNVMALLFAALGGVSLYVIAVRLGASQWQALFAPLIAFGLKPFLRGAVLAEVDVVACGLILLATAASVSGKAQLSAVAFGAGMLVTPLSALTLPVFLLTISGQIEDKLSIRRRLQRIAIFAGVSLVTYLPLVLLHWNDYWNAGRGLLHAPSEPWNLAEQVGRSVQFFASIPGALLAISLFGLIATIPAGRSLARGTAASILLAAVIGERFLDVPVQLPQLCLLVAFAVSFLGRIPRRAVATVALFSVWLVTAPPAYAAVTAEIRDRVQRRAEYLEMARQTPRLFAVGLPSSWDDGLPFERLTYGKTKLGFGLDFGQFGRSSRTIARTHRDHAIWLMSPPGPTTMNDFRSHWHAELREVAGNRYEVWLPNDHPLP